MSESGGKGDILIEKPQPGCGTGQSFVIIGQQWLRSSQIPFRQTPPLISFGKSSCRSGESWGLSFCLLIFRFAATWCHIAGLHPGVSLGFTKQCLAVAFMLCTEIEQGNEGANA